MHVIGANPTFISLEYTRWYGAELPAAMQMADEHCQRYGKRAQMGSQGTGANPIDRALVTFNCVR